MNEHEIEPVPGLPEELPAGESLLWQGRPNYSSMVRYVFHIRALAVYFGALMIWCVTGALGPDGSLAAIAMPALRLLGLSVVALGLVALFVRLVERTTLYTITNRRVVMRFGVALPMTINIPFNLIDEAALKLNRNGSGDIALALSASEKISYLLLWPHARPWRMRRPMPALRAISDPAGVAELFGHALAATLAQPDFTAAAVSIERPAPAMAGRYTPSTEAA